MTSGRARPNGFAPDGIEAELRRLNYDTANATHPAAMAALMKLVPVSQITYGTDYPYFPLDQINSLRQLDLPPADLDAIASGNADAAGAAARRVNWKSLSSLACSRRFTAAGRSGASANPAAGPPAQTDVAIALVLAVDTSGSVSTGRFELQKQGYAAAFRSPQVLNAIRSLATQSIAVTMMQWTGPRLHVVVADWTLIKDEASANAFAAAIEAAPRQLFGGGTSISGAIDYSRLLLAQSPFKGVRRVIDISGDGSNNSGRPVTQARDEAVARRHRHQWFADPFDGAGSRPLLL